MPFFFLAYYMVTTFLNSTGCFKMYVKLVSHMKVIQVLNDKLNDIKYPIKQGNL